MYRAFLDHPRDEELCVRLLCHLSDIDHFLASSVLQVLVVDLSLRAASRRLNEHNEMQQSLL